MTEYVDFYECLVKFSKNNPMNVVIVGAMDGISFDNIGDYIHDPNWSVAFVEPVQHYMDQLKQNFGEKSNFTFINKGISDKTEVKTFVKIKNESIDSGEVVRGIGGMTTIYPPKNNMKHLINDATFDQHLEKVDFECVDVITLKKELPFNKINYLQIDTEGYDWMILKQFTPGELYFIKIEHYSLDEIEKNELFQYFEDNNYYYHKALEDTYAIRRDVLEPL